MSQEIARNFGFEEVSENKLSLLMQLYDDKARQRDELELEYYLLERFELFDPDSPDKSKINQLIEQQNLAGETLASLSVSGE